MRRLLTILLLSATPGVSLGQQGIDKYLAPNSQIYFRWDGFESHREVFDKTAAGKMLKGDTGKFIFGLWDYLTDQIEPLLVQVDPDVAAVAKVIPGAVSALVKHGFVMTVEVGKFEPLEAQAVFVFPGNGGPTGKLSSLVKTILEVSGAQTKTIRDGTMEMKVLSEPPVNLAFGSDGTNALLVIGNVNPAGVMRRRNDLGNNVTKHPLYKELSTFKEFHVWAQGYVDVAGLAKSAASVSPALARLIDDLGLRSLRSITLHTGFEGLAECSVIDFHITGPRKGLLNLTRGRTFSLSELPPLPHDMRGFTAGSLDAPLLYDTFTQVGEGAVRAFSAEAADFIKEAIKQAELLIGVNIRNDLLGSLGSLVVNYKSPSESPIFGIGSVTLIKVDNEKKLLEAVAAIQKTFPAIPNVELEVKFKKFRGVDVVEIQLGPGFTTPTFAIYKGWLVWASYPQPVHGFILRAQGELPTWKLEARTEKALAPFPKEFISISLTDPAPGVQFLLSLAPPVLSAMNGSVKQFLPGVGTFDVSLVPHPLEATRHLFPNVSISTDNGTRFRIWSRWSVSSLF